METVLDLPSEIKSTPKLNLQERQAATLAALDSFMEQDAAEHQETMHVLREALDKDRPDQRRIFDEGHTAK